MKTIILHRGEVLFREGGKGDLFRLNKGLLKVTKVRENGDVFQFNILVPGEMFPHASLITPGPYLGTVVALTKCEVERISADEWYRTLEQDPERYREAALALEQTLRKLQRRVEMTTVPKSLAAHSLAEKMAFRILLDFIAGEIADSGRNGQFLGMSR